MAKPVRQLLNGFLLARTDSATICGDLLEAYPNVQAPTCTGTLSICTFSRGLQGCCDSGGSCQFYTTCIGHFDPATCIGVQCLGCTNSVPYCIKYSFWDQNSQTSYDGYSCGIFQDTSTVFGVASSMMVPATAAATTTTAPTSSTTVASSIISSSASSSLLSSLSSTAQTSSVVTVSSVSTSSSPSPTGTSLPQSKSVSHTGAIVGGILGGFAGLALVAALYLMYTKYIRNFTSRRRPRVGNTVPEVQQMDNA